MDPVTFVVSALAGGALKKVAEDVYAALKGRLVALVGGAAVAAVEAKPASETARAFLAEQISENPAAQADPELPKLAAAMAEALAQLPDDDDLGGSITVQDIRAGREVILRQLEAHPGGGILVEGMRASGKIHISGITSGYKEAD